MRKLFLSLIGVVFSLLVPSSVPASSRAFDGVSTYQIYYDTVSKKMEQDMKNYDLVILEPREVTKDQVTRIRDNGTMVLGYVNVMEADEWNREVMDQLEAEDFFYREGEKVFFPEWNSYLMDLTSTHYQSILKQDMEVQVIDKGFDGIFLDTVGDIDDQHAGNEDVLTAQRQAYVKFLKSIRREYGSVPIVQNWGFGTLADVSAPYVDGIMWERFQYDVIQDEWSQDRIEELIELRQKYGVDVFTVSYEQEKKSTAYARERGFIHTHEPNYYNQWTY